MIDSSTSYATRSAAAHDARTLRIDGLLLATLLQGKHDNQNDEDEQQTDHEVRC